MSQTTDLSHECLLALGDLVVAFNDVEKLMKDFIGCLLRIGGAQSAIVTYRLHWPALLDRIYALYAAEVARPDLQKDLSDTLDGLLTCNTRRNEFIHSEWSLGFGNEDIPILFKPFLDSRFKQNPPPADPEKAPLREVHPDKINQLANDLRKHEHTLRDTMTKLRLFRHMSPRPEFLIDWRTPDEFQ